MLLKRLTFIMLIGVCAQAGSAQPVLKTAVRHDGDTVSASRASRRADSSLLWYDAELLRIEGKGWTDTPTFYARLPTHAKDAVTSPVWRLSSNTAGICVRFVTDSTTIAATWDGIRDVGEHNHFAATGSAGLDLYVRRNGKWEYAATGRPKSTTTTANLRGGLPRERNEYLLYLPTYHPISIMQIGVDAQAYLAPAPAREPGKSKPIVFYGTSITQGGCASRAGMGHVTILGRWLNREVINLGFSGSGKMEPAMGELLAELDPELFVLECLPNMTTELVKQRIESFVVTLRAKRPNTPILLVENPIQKHTYSQNVALQEIYANLKKGGMTKLGYLEAEQQLAGTENGTVDGVHPTDLGFVRMAEAYLPVMKEMLGE